MYIIPFSRLTWVAIHHLSAGFAMLCVALSASAKAQDASTEAEAPEISVVELSERIKQSLVKIRVPNRERTSQWHGSGFVIGSNGLIATARHVIGDRKLVTIELPDGRVTKATHVYAAPESIDAAILKVDAENLTPLPLSNATELKTGQSVVTVGLPGSLKKSTFTGILSGFKEIDGIDMLQLSMTIEPGSSGEPVVDRQGNVIGLVTLKSTEVANLGFAIPVDTLKQMLEDPVPVPMSHWGKIGSLDAKRWENVFGADWSQRAGHILVEGQGDSFGGRSLCLQVPQAPDAPFEVQVDVKLEDERGAAGLAFHSDGNEKHFGFYPSNGNIRLTRFNGPDLGSWTILHNEPHSAYRKDRWNTFKVRVEKDRILCFLNDELVVKSTDDRLPVGRIGLATFRGTAAEFRRFKTGKTLPSLRPDSEAAAAIDVVLEDVQHDRPAPELLVQQLAPFREYSTLVLEERARELEQKAKQIRQLSRDVHAANVRDEILKALGHHENSDDNKTPPDLLKAALLIAVLDNEEVEAEAYINRVDQLAEEIKATLKAESTEAERLSAMEDMLFKKYGFCGSRYEYETRENSYLNEVIDDRRGIPITLSVLYIEVAKRLDLNVVGLGLPNHYVVRFEPADPDASSEIIDVFNRGKRLTDDEAREAVRRRGYPLLPEFFEGQEASAIIHRMLLNLLGLAEALRDDERVLRYLDTLIAIDSSDLGSRFKRFDIRVRTNRLQEAIADANWILKQELDETITDRLYEYRAKLQRRLDLQAAE